MDPTNFDFDELECKVQPTLTKSEMALRDKFVIEYVKDYNALDAAIRIGYTLAFAKEFAPRFMSESYVLNQIKKQETAPEGIDFENEDALKRQVYASLWREANFHGAGSSQAARVAALSKLSAFHGMDAPSRSKQELTGPDGQPLQAGGVLVIPGVMTSEQWAAQAEQQQADLVRPEVKPPQLKLA